MVGPILILEDDDLSDKYVSVQMDIDGLKAPNGLGLLRVVLQNNLDELRLLDQVVSTAKTKFPNVRNMFRLYDPCMSSLV